MRYAKYVLFVLAILVSASAFGQALQATLSGANEVPPADPDGSGTATIILNGTTVIYTITVANIAAPTMQHIHIGPAGVNGPIVVNLPGVFVGGVLTGTTTTDAATAFAISQNPGGYYVNVHNAEFPGGAIRGQLGASSMAAAPTVSPAALVTLFGILAIAGVLAIKRFI